MFNKIIVAGEGETLNPDDNGSPSKYGIRFKDNMEALQNKALMGDAIITSPDQMNSLTKQQAHNITKYKYWGSSKASLVKDPRIAALLIDAYYNSPLLHGKMLARVPEFNSIKNLEPTASNIAKLDAVYEKLKAQRLSIWRGFVDSGANKEKDWIAWNNRQEALDNLSKEARKSLAAPANFTDLPKGNQQLLEQAFKLSKDNLHLYNTNDLDGFTVGAVVKGVPTPLNTHSFKEIYEWKQRRNSFRGKGSNRTW
jgi:hypothetical protein